MSSPVETGAGPGSASPPIVSTLNLNSTTDSANSMPTTTGTIPQINASSDGANANHFTAPNSDHRGPLAAPAFQWGVLPTPLVSSLKLLLT